MKLYEGDCLKVLNDISDNSVDCIIADLPYARLGQVLSWDVAVDLEKLWPHLWRVCKYNSPIFLFADFKFATHLIQSQPKYFRYEIVWVKNKTTTPLLSRKRFGMCTEYVLVFYKKLPPYYYLNHHKLIKRYKTKGKFASCMGLEKKRQTVCEYKPVLPLNVVEQDGVMKRAKKEMRQHYEPKLPLNVLEEGENDKVENEIITTTNYECSDCVGAIMNGMYRQPGRMYDPVLPLNVIKSPSVARNKVIRNITEKPQKVLKRLLNYYTKEGDVVLDFCMGSGSCGMACIDLNREFIGIEMKPEHFEKAKKRLEDYLKSMPKIDGTAPN